MVPADETWACNPGQYFRGVDMSVVRFGVMVALVALGAACAQGTSPPSTGIAQKAAASAAPTTAPVVAPASTPTPAPPMAVQPPPAPAPQPAISLTFAP